MSRESGDPSSQSTSDGATSELWQLSGMGFELAGSIAGGGLIGWLIDQWAGTGQRWLLIGLVVGIIVGGVNFARRAIAMNRRAMNAYRARRERLEGKGNGHAELPGRATGGDWFAREQHELDEDEDEDDPELRRPPDFDDW